MALDGPDTAFDFGCAWRAIDLGMQVSLSAKNRPVVIAPRRQTYALATLPGNMLGAQF